MTTRKSKTTKPPANETETTIELGEIVRAAEASFADADTSRVEALTDLAGLRSARALVLRRKRADIAAGAGGEETEDVKTLDASIDEVAAAVKSLKAQAAIAAKPMPAPKPNETVVHGVIRGAEATGVGGIKLSLADDTGPIKGATATSDSEGHFEIRHAAGDKPPRKLALHVHDDRHPQPIDVEPGAGVVRFVVVRLED